MSLTSLSCCYTFDVFSFHPDHTLGCTYSKLTTHSKLNGKEGSKHVHVQPSQGCQSHNQVFTTWTVGLVAILSLFLVARTSLKSLGSMTRAHLHQRRWQIRKSSPPLPSASGRCHMCGSKGTKIPRLTKRAILLQQHDCLRSSNTLQLKLQNSEQ